MSWSISALWTIGTTLSDCPQPESDPIEATFELNETLHAKALVPTTEEVYLWLGANVMLSYPIVEAESLLEGKLSGAQQTLANCQEDLDFLREQITVSVYVTFVLSMLI